MDFFGKKGVTAYQVMGLVIALVVILIILGPSVTTTKIAKAHSEIEQCRLSVISSSIEISYGVKLWNLELFRPTAPNPFYIDCPKRYGYIYKSSIKIDGAGSDLKKKPAEREDQLKDLILNEMTNCWRSFGDASDKVYTAAVGDDEKIDTSDMACFACSEIFIAKDFEPIKLNDFYTYANEKQRLTTGHSYVQFLTGGTDIENVPQDKSITLQKGEQWSVIFTIKRVDNRGWFDHLKWLPFGGIPIAIGSGVKEGNLPKVNSAIIDCYMLNENRNGETTLVKYEGSSIGCDNGQNDGIIFGKVAEGYDRKKLDILGLVGSGLTGGVKSDVARFPMTVRFVPTKDIFKDGQCKRLY